MLDELGPRICILGRSNSGKSTLAEAVGRKLGLPPVHLDQLRHQPDTHWQFRPLEDFLFLHDAAIRRERWVVEGNYSVCLPGRLERATGLIVLNVSTLTSVVRYVRRTVSRGYRAGNLTGAKNSVEASMLYSLVRTSPLHSKRYEAVFENAPLPKIYLGSAREIERFYAREALAR